MGRERLDTWTIATCGECGELLERSYGPATGFVWSCAEHGDLHFDDIVELEVVERHRVHQLQEALEEIKELALVAGKPHSSNRNLAVAGSVARAALVSGGGTGDCERCEGDGSYSELAPCTTAGKDCACNGPRVSVDPCPDCGGTGREGQGQNRWWEEGDYGDRDEKDSAASGSVPGDCVPGPDVPITPQAARVIVAAAEDYDKRVPREQGDLATHEAMDWLRQRGADILAAAPGEPLASPSSKENEHG